MRFAVFHLIMALWVLWRFVLPLDLPRRFKAALALLVVVAASFSTVTVFFFGGLLSPEAPRWFLIAGNSGEAVLLFLCGLTAAREVHEETGILGEVVDSIATIDYWFTGTTQRVHKLVHHFALKQTGGELTVEGAPDHEAEDAIWVRFEDLDGVLSYPNERKIAWLYARKKNRQANE